MLARVLKGDNVSEQLTRHDRAQTLKRRVEREHLIRQSAVRTVSRFDVFAAMTKSMFEIIRIRPAAERTGHDYHQKWPMKAMTAPPNAVVSLMSAKATVPPKIILNITLTNVPT
jgi:hypothetical protein